MGTDIWEQVLTAPTKRRCDRKIKKMRLLVIMMGFHTGSQK